MAEVRRGSIVRTIAGVGIGLLSLYFFLLFFRDSGNLERFLEEKTQDAFREMLWLFAYLFLCLMGFLLKRKMQDAPEKGNFSRREASGAALNIAFLSFLFLLFILPTLVFAYLHRMLLPMLISGLWFFVLALLFRFVSTGRPLQIFADIKQFFSFLEKDFQEGALYPLVFALPFFILQMNRSNVALDYDSLRYGLRSAYVLFPEGFFSAHGQINSVYSYPKGLELLTYPLNYLPGYGFLLSFSLWTYLALALVFGLLLFHFQKNRKKLYIGILCFFLLSSVGNMSLTMKTDLFTLLLQLSALYFFLKGKRLQSCFLLFFSYSFKPTAVVFSTLLGIVLLLCFSMGSASEISSQEESAKGSKLSAFLLKSFAFSPFYLAAFLTTITTSWAGAVGFTPIDLANKGYYDHGLVELENQGEKGSLPAFSEMAKNPRHHVLAFSETPECYRIPCNVQSITDVEGSGGSPGLYDSPLYFAWFLKWSGTDYVYLEQSFLHDEREERAREMLLQMAEEGIFQSPMLVEKNEILPLDGVKAFSEANGEGAEQLLLLQIRKERLEYPWNKEPYPALTKEEIVEKDKIVQLLSEYLQ